MFERRETGEIGVLRNLNEYDYEMKNGDLVRLVRDDGSETIPYNVKNLNTHYQGWVERSCIEWFDGSSKKYD